MRPYKIKRTVAVRLNVACGNAVDLLLKNHARKERHHHRRWPAPPSFRDDVQKALIIELHVGFEAADLSHLRGLARCLTGAPAGGHHGRMPVVCVHAQL